MRKLIIGIVVMMIAGTVSAATVGFPPEGVYGGGENVKDGIDPTGCLDYALGTEGDYISFDSDGKGWGGYGEMNCDIESLNRVGKDFHIESKCTMIGAEDAPMTPTNILTIVSPTEIILDGKTYRKCPDLGE